jgi:hypothetical protein
MTYRQAWWLKLWTNTAAVVGTWACTMLAYIQVCLEAHKPIDWRLLLSGLLAAVVVAVRQRLSAASIQAPAIPKK